jgi:hypothetical protein
MSKLVHDEQTPIPGTGIRPTGRFALVFISLDI